MAKKDVERIARACKAFLAAYERRSDEADFMTLNESEAWRELRGLAVADALRRAA